MGKEKLVPGLRFPEFLDDGCWSEKELINSADKKVKWSFTGGPFGSNLKASDYRANGIRIIQLQNIGDGEFNDENKIYTTVGKADELLSCNIYAGDIIISKMGDPVGRACLIPKDLERCVMASDGIRLVVDEKKHSKYFIYSLINSKQIREAIEKKATGSTRKRIGLDALREVKLVLPKSVKEQQKIASCLSSLDELIQAQKQKLAALKNHKTGLMQNLFPQKEENVPKYRFKEFDNDGDWRKKPLSSVAEIITGSTPVTSETRYYNGDKLFVSPADINDERYVVQTKTTLSDIGFSKTRKIKANSVLFVCIGSTIGKVAQNKFECATNQQLNSLIAFEKNSSNFLYSILDFNSAKIASIAGNHAVPIINKSSFSSIELSFPPTTLEQKKIASCLSTLDNLITMQEEKIEQLKFHKKGLMQGLFPKNNI